LEIGKEDLNTNVLNIIIRQPCVFVYIQPDIRNHCRSRHLYKKLKVGWRGIPTR